MFVVLQLDTYNSCGCDTTQDVYGPFPNRPAAEAFMARVEKVKLVGQGYRIKQVLPEQKLVDWIDQLGVGKVPRK